MFLFGLNGLINIRPIISKTGNTFSTNFIMNRIKANFQFNNNTIIHVIHISHPNIPVQGGKGINSSQREIAWLILMSNVVIAANIK